MAWEPDRRYNFFFSPPAHLCAVTYMTEISLIVTLNNQFNSTQLNLCVVLLFKFLYARLQTGRIMVWWCPSVRVSVRPSQFSALFSYMLWDIELKFCISLYYDARKSKFECHQFPSIFDGVMPLFNFKLLQICSFPHFSPSCFDILSWNFAYDFVLLYYRTSSSVANFRQFLLELCPFWNLEYWKYTVYRTFLLHALTY